MSMDEILALQEELAAVQQTTTMQRLSDRNCVELVVKLQSLNLIDLIFTSTGKEYLTPSHLITEIQDELLIRGGRVNITDLSDTLNVALTHIETAIPSVISDSTVRLIRGELIADHYLSALIDEINDALAASSSGVDTLADLATRYTLPVDLLRKTLTAHSDRLRAQFDPEAGTVTSQSAISRHQAIARGLLRATSTPTTLSDAASAHNIPLPLLTAVTSSLLDAGTLSGTLSGHGPHALFIPTVFRKAVIRFLVADFTANSFLPFQAFTRLHISDPVAFAEENLQDSLILSETVVGVILIDTLMTSATEALDSGSWLDITSSLPPSFPEPDISAVADRVAATVQPTLSKEVTNDADTGVASQPKLKGRLKRKAKTKASSAASPPATISSAVVFEQRYVVSRRLVECFHRAVEEDANARAQERAREMAQRLETVGAVTVVGAQKTTESIDDREEDVIGKKSKGKGRRRKIGKEKQKVPAPVNADEGHPIAVPEITEVIELILNSDECSATVESDYLEMSANGNDMVHSVIMCIYGDEGIRELFVRKADEAVLELERERAAAKLALERSLLEDLESMEMYDRTAETLHELAGQSREWVVVHFGGRIVRYIIEGIARDCGIVVDLSNLETSSTRKRKAEALREACSKLPDSISSQIAGVVRVIAGKGGESVSDFLERYDSITSPLDLPERRALDKKSERAAWARGRGAALEKLAEMETTAKNHLEILKAVTITAFALTQGGSVVDFDEREASLFSERIEVFIGESDTHVADIVRQMRQVLSTKDEQMSTEAGSASSVGLIRPILEDLRKCTQSKNW